MNAVEIARTINNTKGLACSPTERLLARALLEAVEALEGADKYLRLADRSTVLRIRDKCHKALASIRGEANERG